MVYSIKGFLETSFVDWEGKVAAVIFLGGCNFRCGFCYNGSLVLEPDKMPDIDWQVITEYLAAHNDWLDGVVITGGEPTICPNLKELIAEIKKFRLAVKLDTNGSRPEVVSELLAEGLVDYTAMDYKAPLDARYKKAIGLELTPLAGQSAPGVTTVTTAAGLAREKSTAFDLDQIRQSIKILLASHKPVEFRTTAVPGIIDEEGIKKMAQDLLAAWQQSRQDMPPLISEESESPPFKFVLQPFKPAQALDENLRLVKPYSIEQMFKFKRLVSSILGRCYLR